MQYAILRVQKLKSAVAVHRSMKHSFRAQDTPNADPSLTPENTHIGAQSVAEGMAAFRDRLPEKFRKDAVQCVEYLMTASPEAIKSKSREEQDAYFRDSLDWLKRRHGAENVVYAGIHRDEQTPHMYAYVVPRDPESGRLNAKKWFGGARALRDMQTEFAEQVGRQHGFERGIEGSKATHQRVQRYYEQVNRPTPVIEKVSPQLVEPRVLKKGLLRSEIESPEMVAERVTKAVQKAIEPALQKAKQADEKARRASEMARTAETLARDKKRLEEALKSQQKRFAPLVELEQQDPQAARSVLRQVQEQLLLDKVRKEFARRVAELPRLARSAAGAVLTLAKRGMAALDGAGGKIDAVDWDKVETLAIAESVREHRQKPEEVYSAMMKHSPASADAETNPQRGERVRALVEHFAGKSVSMDRVKQQEQGRDYSQ